MSFDFPFVQPSFLRGAARVLDLGGTLDRGVYGLTDSPNEADARAVLADWHAVAADAREAFAATASLVARGRGGG